MSEKEHARARALDHGQLCYLQLPAVDAPKSAEFYQAVFGWHVEAPATLDSVEANGGVITRAPEADGPYRMLATILDPAGNPIGLASHHLAT